MSDKFGWDNNFGNNPKRSIDMSTIVGKRYKAPDGHTYIADSYVPRIGVWMTREDCPPEHRADTEGQWRRNVSERAIGRTFHEV